MDGQLDLSDFFPEELAEKPSGFPEDAMPKPVDPEEKEERKETEAKTEEINTIKTETPVKPTVDRFVRTVKEDQLREVADAKYAEGYRTVYIAKDRGNAFLVMEKR